MRFTLCLSIVFYSQILVAAQPQPLVIPDHYEMYDTDGISLPFYLDAKTAFPLYQLVFDNRAIFSEFLVYKNSAETVLKPKHISCKGLFWKPLKLAELNNKNRIECEIELGPTKKQKRSFLWFGLDKVSSNGLLPDPGITIEGPFSEKLAKLIDSNKDSPSFLEKYSIQRLKNSAGEDYFIVGEVPENRPFFACESGPRPRCEFRWTQLESFSTRVSLGENSVRLGQAICAKQESLPISGRCPEDFNRVKTMDCDYVGLWVPHGTWGVVDTEAQIDCRFNEGGIAKSLKLSLGTVLTQPWGTRFSSPSISIRGPELANFYFALKEYSIKNKDWQKAVEYSNMGEGEWGFQSTSLRRYSFPENNSLSSLSCEQKDTSYSSFLQTPHRREGYEREVFDCSIHKDSR